MAIDLSAGMITATVGLLGVLLGTVLGPYFNHKLSLKNNRKDLLFRRKLEYFEKLAESMEQNIRMYRNSINEAELSNNGFKKIIQKLKKQRTNYLSMSSPLYFNVKNLSNLITQFVSVEKEIFEYLPKLEEKEDKPLIIASLKERLKTLILLRNRIISEMKKELSIW